MLFKKNKVKDRYTKLKIFFEYGNKALNLFSFDILTSKMAS